MTITVTYGAEKPPERPGVPWGWFHIPHPNPTVMEVHCMPASDCGRHAFDLRCACRPHEDLQAPGFIMHSAYDGREAYETGLRKHH